MATAQLAFYGAVPDAPYAARAPYVTDTTAGRAARAATNAAEAANAANATRAASAAARATYAAAADASLVASAANAVVYTAANVNAAADAAVIEAGQTPERRATLAIQLSGHRLRFQGMPPRVAEAWTRLKVMLLARKNEDWEVWTDWYENRLAGRPADRYLELARVVLLTDKKENRPKIINAAIRTLIEAHKASDRVPDLPDEASLPKPTSSAAIFRLDANGVIGLAPPGPADRLADTEEVRDFYDETRHKLESLIALGRNMLGPRLDDEAERFRSRLPEAISEAVERRVWSSGNTMRGILGAHVAVTHEAFHDDKLEPGAVERLSDLVETYNQLAFADPSLRRRDESRPGPQEHERSVDRLSSVIEIVDEAAGNRDITNPNAGDELNESVAVAKNPKPSLFGRLGIEHASHTVDNFLNNLLINVYRAARGTLRLAEGKGGFVPKEFFGGIYKEAGKYALNTGIGVSVGAYTINPEIVSFFYSHLVQLGPYFA